MKSVGVFLFTFLLSVSLSACHKKMSRPFRIVNNSGVEIVNMSFGGVIEGNEISLKMGETSEIIYLYYQRRIRLSPKLLKVTINDYLPVSNLKVIQPNSIPFDKKDLSEYNNLLTITSEEVGDTLFFYTKLN